MKYIDISDAQTIVTSPDPTGVNNQTILQKSLISKVNGTFVAKPNGVVPPGFPDDSQYWNYRYPSMTIVTITMNDGSEERFELQDIPNGSFVGFTGNPNNGIQSDLNSAITDIQNSL